MKLIINKNSSSRLFISAVGMPPTCTDKHAVKDRSGREAHHSRELDERGKLKATSYLGIIRVVVIYIVEELRRHHHAAVHKVSKKWSVAQGWW